MAKARLASATASGCEAKRAPPPAFLTAAAPRADMTEDTLPRFLSTGEAAFACQLWYHRQPDKALHHIRILCELAEVRDYLRDGFITPLSRPETQILCDAPVK